MTSEAQPARILYENLDTSFVNLWGLLRYLSQQSFIGRVHVELSDYSADVFLNGSDNPLVHEVDRAAGTDVTEAAALHRLVLRVRESSGKITVYEGADEAVAPAAAASEGALAERGAAATPESMCSSAGKDDGELAPETTVVRESPPPVAPSDSKETIRLGGELIGAVERATIALAADFSTLFREARVGLGDDYTFLDPVTGSLRFENSALTMSGADIPDGFVVGISEALRCVVDRLATGERARRTRERIALELARVARKNGEGLARAGFKDHLDRIAGTKVI